MGAPPPLRLQHLEIRDFRGIDHLEIDFPLDEDGGGMLVLAGANGCGKTSVLEAILLLLGRLDLLPADRAPASELTRQGAADFYLEGSLLVRGNVEKPAVRGETIGKAEEESGGWNAFDRSRDVPLASEYGIQFISARREPASLKVPTADPRGTLDERRLAELKRRLANVFAAQRGRDEVFGRIERFMAPFFGDAWHLDVIFRSSELGAEPMVVVRNGPLPKNEQGELRTFDAIRAHAASGGVAPRVIPIDRLSSGEMALLAIAYPFVFNDRPVDIALIDEPEQHLHVSWQRAFLGALRKLSPTTQFIVATHSSEVLDSVASYERCELRPDDDLGPVHDAAQ